jgi:hypothetical protein
MKKIIDIFEYHDKWGIGGNCTCCEYSNVHHGVQDDWPAENMNCGLHKINLNIELSNGYLDEEYFCKDMKILESSYLFNNIFNIIKNNLEYNILYKACNEEYLRMISFDDIRKIEK